MLDLRPKFTKLLKNRAALLALGIGVVNALLSAASALFQARKLAVGFAVGSAFCAIVVSIITFLQTRRGKPIQDVERPDVSTELRTIGPPRQADTASSLESDPIVTTGIERATQPGLRRRASLAHIGIEVEPPSPTTSDEDSDEERTPVPPPHPVSANRFARPPPQQQPGYLTPHRSPLDLAPIQLTEPGPATIAPMPAPPVFQAPVPAGVQNSDIWNWDTGYIALYSPESHRARRA
ncbi:hypothetical protein V5O48_015825 [Marasmius crinis-equi]|uniref:Uncharacterized protein n=1 Tax=Marasmius crinis-equi TaxID=585013 RepID=A0ABR3ETH5_9AGAR